MEPFFYVLLFAGIIYFIKEMSKGNANEQLKDIFEQQRIRNEAQAAAKKQFEEETRDLVGLAGKEEAMKLLEKQVADIDFQIRDLEADEEEFGFSDEEQAQRHKKKMDAYRAKRNPLVDAWNLIKYRMWNADI